MNDVEYVLDFVVILGNRMLGAGANLERVNDTMTRVCLSYHLESISIYSLSSTIMVSARSADGIYGSRHIAVQPARIHLERLNQLNRLSRIVCAKTPAPSSLTSLLDEALSTEEYSIPKIIVGYMIAMTSLCVIFGGTVGDVIASDCITFVLSWLIRWLSGRNLNRIVVNTLCMWLAGILGLLLVRIGIGNQYFIIIITSSMMMIPGIPLVNAVRNLLCGNEMNGILEILKVLIETVAIVLGLVLSIYMFGGGDTVVESLKLIVFSFTASLGFGIVFRIGKKNLLWAGVGGVLTRCIYLFLLEVIDQRILYSLLAAMFAALYAEIMAMRQKMPSTVFLYPAIIPLIPGDLLYNTAVNLFLQNTPEMLSNAKNCSLSLAGMSIGFVLISTFTYYRRIYHVGTDIAHHLLRQWKKDSVEKPY